MLYMGDTGVGKSVVMEKYLDNASSGAGGNNEFVAYTMKYSAQTKPTNLKDMFETKLEKKRKTLYGPPSGKKMLFFIDDLNMPALEVCCLDSWTWLLAFVVLVFAVLVCCNDLARA